MTEQTPPVRRRVAAAATAVTIGLGASAAGAVPAGAASTSASSASPAPAPAAVADVQVPGVPVDHLVGYDPVLDRIVASWSPPTSDSGLPVTAFDLFLDGGYLGSVGPETLAVSIGTSSGRLRVGPHTIGVRAVNTIGAGQTSSVGVVVAPTPTPPTPAPPTPTPPTPTTPPTPPTPPPTPPAPPTPDPSTPPAPPTPTPPTPTPPAPDPMPDPMPDPEGEPTPDLEAPVPGEPTDVVATPSDGAVTVRWTAPSDDGSPVESYRVTASPGDVEVEVDGDEVEARIEGLTNGTAYSFEVVAVNAFGTSRPGATAGTVVPAGRPDRPRRPRLEVRGRRILVTWDATTANGSDITAYRVRVVGRGVRVVRGQQRVVLRDLGPGRFRVRVVAINAEGRSPASPATRVRVRR